MGMCPGIVAAAVAYSFHCIRLEGFAKETSAIRLAASKAVTELVLSVSVLLGLRLFSTNGQSLSSSAESTSVFVTFCRTSSDEVVSFLETSPGLLGSPSNDLLAAGLATLWTGLVTVAYTISAQTYGQRRVRPVTANLIYTIQPLCTAIIAWVVLGETLGPSDYIGGALLGIAVLMVTLPAKRST